MKFIVTLGIGTSCDNAIMHDPQNVDSILKSNVASICDRVTHSLKLTLIIVKRKIMKKLSSHG